jgi:DNA-binding response OmpR family regulator
MHRQLKIPMGSITLAPVSAQSVEASSVLVARPGLPASDEVQPSHDRQGYRRGFVARYERENSRAEAAPTPPKEESILYLGTPYGRWDDVKQTLAGRLLRIVTAGNPRALPQDVDLGACNLVIVGESVEGREPHEVCAQVRRLGFRGPMLLISNPADPVARILGLENGADAWIASDSDARSCVAQIRALMRRPMPQITSPSNVLRVGTLTLNPASREVAAGRERLELSTLEFNLLWILARHAGEIMPRDEMADLMGYTAGGMANRTIDTAISRLRQRLGGVHAQQIRTIRSVGYMLCADSMFEPDDRALGFVN